MKASYLRQNNVVARAGAPTVTGGQAPCRRVWPVFRTAAGLLVLVATLACGFLDQQAGQAADPIAVQGRLPTLTSTPAVTVSSPATAAQTTPATSISDSGASAIAAVAGEPGATVAGPTRDAASETTEPNRSPTTAVLANSGEVMGTAPAGNQASPAATTPPAASSPTATPTPTPTNEPTATAMPTFTATPAGPEAPTPVFEASGWSFSSVQIYDDQYEEGLLLYGDVTNNTGISQELYTIGGVFYDPQGQIIADESSTDDFWPIEIIPPGARMPFGLFIDGAGSIADFELNVAAEPSDQMPHQNFNFAEASIANGGTEYCIQGRLQNLGDPLRNDVSIMAILFDSQDRVINFDDSYEPEPAGLVGDATLALEFCVDDLGLDIARYEIRAWGE